MKKSVLTMLGAAALLASSGSAWATTAKTAANTQIVNTATLTYTLGGTPSSTSAHVNVLVSLIPSAPQVSISNPGAVNFSGTDSPVLTDTVTITSTANGPASYTIAAGINAQGNTSTASIAATSTQITLGASVTSQKTTSSNILYVPAVDWTVVDAADNSANQVNGLAPGDKIIFTDAAGITQTEIVQTVVNPGTATGTAQITVVGSYTVNVGTPIYEQTSTGSGNFVNLNVKPGTFVTGGAFITVDAKATVSGTGFSDVIVMNSTASTNANAGDTTKAPTNLNVWITVPASVHIDKFVRNLSDGNANPSANCQVTITGTSGVWCDKNVSAKSGNILEYAVIAKNTAVDVNGNLTSCNISDYLQPSFLGLNCDGYNVGADVNYIDTLGNTHPLKACNGQTAATWNNQANWDATATNPGPANLMVFVGNGAAANQSGTLPYGNQVTITYQAKVK